MKYLFLLLTPAICLGQETMYKASSQQLQWTGHAAIGSYAPQGTLQIDSGFLNLVDGRPSTVEIWVDMNSLDQENKDLAGHLRNKDFFDVKKYPRAHFITEEVVATGNDEFVLKGTFTIKDRSNKEKIRVRLIPHGDSYLLEFDHQMDRTLYGVIYNSPSFFKNLKDQAIGNAFELKGNIRFVRTTADQR
jgi:polyisoprenoid-binding protein YceI